jgi:hypothetical protein
MQTQLKNSTKSQFRKTIIALGLVFFVACGSEKKPEKPEGPVYVDSSLNLSKAYAFEELSPCDPQQVRSFNTITKEFKSMKSDKEAITALLHFEKFDNQYSGKARCAGKQINQKTHREEEVEVDVDKFIRNMRIVLGS